MTRPATARERRRLRRKFAHGTGYRFTSCNRLYRGFCWRCAWWTLTGHHRRERRKFMEQANRVRDGREPIKRRPR